MKRAISTLLALVLIIETPVFAAPRGGAARVAAAPVRSAPAPARSLAVPAAAAPSAFVNIAVGDRPMMFRPSLLSPSPTAAVSAAAAQPLSGGRFQTAALSTPIFGPNAGQPVTPPATTQPPGSILNPSPTSPQLPTTPAPPGFFASLSWPEKIFLGLTVALVAFQLYRMYTKWQDDEKEEKERRQRLRQKRELREQKRQDEQESINQRVRDEEAASRRPLTQNGERPADGTQPPVRPDAQPLAPQSQPLGEGPRNGEGGMVYDTIPPIEMDSESPAARRIGTDQVAAPVQPRGDAVAPPPVVQPEQRSAEPVDPDGGRPTNGEKPKAPVKAPTDLARSREDNLQLTAGFCAECEIPKDPRGEILNAKSKSNLDDVAEITRRVQAPSARGARRVLATMEQSCDMLLDGRTPMAVSPQCDKVNRKPASFGDSQLKFRDIQGKKQIDLFGDGKLSADGFLTALFSNAGLKVRRLSTSTQVRTEDILRGTPDCLKPLTMTRNETIATGDMLIVKGQTLVIEKAGSDPFGLNEIKDQSECKNLRPEKFDFSVISVGSTESGAAQRAIQRGSIQELQSPALAKGILTTAFMACQAKFLKPVVALGFKEKLVEFGVYRHLGEKVKACNMNTKIPLVGEACINQCVD